MHRLVQVVKQEWRNLLATAVITALVTVVFVFAFAGLTSGSSRELADRVDQNAALAQKNVAIAVSATQTIVCILRLGVEPSAPPRTDENVHRCADKYGFELDKSEDANP